MGDEFVIGRAVARATLTLALAFSLIGCYAESGGNETPAPLADSSMSPVDAAQIPELQQLLAHWDALVADVPPDAVIVTGELINGGGWNGPNADDQKIAFVDGDIEAVQPLATDMPAPGEVKWSDGSTQNVDLISPSDALAAMVATGEEAGPCKGCEALHVTGAYLTNIDASTSRGDASVPAWEFEFPQEETPMQPITFVAVKDVVGLNDQLMGSGMNGGIRVDAAYGAADSNQLTLTFTGSPWDTSNPCGDDYTASVVESDRAVALIVNEHRSTLPGVANGNPIACPLVGYQRGVTITLARRLGTRTILDMTSAAPVSLKSGPAPQISPLVGPLP